jgi:hypothetical protein
VVITGAAIEKDTGPTLVLSDPRRQSGAADVREEQSVS